MLIAAAICPHLPSLALAADVGAPAAPERLRVACAQAVAAVLAEEPEIVAVVGPGTRSVLHEEGSLPASRDFGIPVGMRLLQQAGWTDPVRAYELDDDRDWPTNGEDGVHLAQWADRVGLLVLGNGPTHADADGARHPDPRAEEINAGIAAALADGDVDGVSCFVATWSP